MWRAFGVFLEGWAKSESGALLAGREDMRRGADFLREQNVLFFDGLLKIALAEIETRGGDLGRAVAILAEALATSERTGHRAFDAELHRVRGETMLKRDPADPAPAEEAFQAAIAVAKRQGTRSFELRAALALAKLYRSTARPFDAHAVLAPALEGFSPTPEMPEIAEAQALLAKLVETEEVKIEAARRQQRRQLHVAYGNALIGARGYGAPETTEAFARARESAVDDKDALERLAADYGLWVGSFVRGELSAMRVHAETFLKDVEVSADSPEAQIAYRIAGATHWFAGEYVEARDKLEHALALFRPGRDDGLAFRFGQDQGVAAMDFLALTLWPLGDVERARALIESAQIRTASVAYIGTRAYEKAVAAWFELMCGNISRAAQNGAELARLARDHDLPFWRPGGVFLEGLGAAKSGAGRGLEEMRRAEELIRDQNTPFMEGLHKIALAEAEASAGDVGRALAILDEALATSERIGHRAFDAELNRVRGDMLLRRDPGNPASAEEAFQAAIAVAKRQGTRSFELRAALALAELYHSTGRPAEAHAVLAPALEGFSPTSEMPEIAEAQALLAALDNNGLSVAVGLSPRS
jgi:predicted ATPase